MHFFAAVVTFDAYSFIAQFSWADDGVRWIFPFAMSASFTLLC